MTTNSYIAQVVLRGATGLAEDRFVNTFHFVGGVDGANTQEMMSAANRLALFYSKTYLQAGLSTPYSVGALISNSVNRLATVNIYDYYEPKPRTPFVYHFNLPAPLDAIKLPEEVALCLSYYSVRNTPRTRGRVYIGPLCQSALQIGGAATLTSRPDPGALATIASAAADLAHVEDGVIDLSNVLVDGLFLAGLILPGLHPETPPLFDPATSFPALENINWAQFSSIGAGTMPTKKHPELPHAPQPAFNLVTAGWVDNEWDGQSRRRVASSARISWVAP